MSRIVTARYGDDQAAEQALAAVAAKIALLDSAVLSDSLAGTAALASMELRPEERAACQAQLKRGGFLLVAQVASGSAAEMVLAVLRGMDGRNEAQAVGAATPPPQAAPAAPAAPPPAAAVKAEERIPLVEEEIRVGKQEVLRGGARVHSFMAEVPVQQEVELFEEQTSVERRPANRRLSDQEVIAGGLLQERVIEVTQIRQEAVVSKEAFVREEVVVRKSVHHRVEQINETVRRTEVETERLPPGERSAFGGFPASEKDRPS